MKNLSRVIQIIAKSTWKCQRLLKMTPIMRVMREIERRGVALRSMKALELFGGSGDMITRDYAPFFKSMEIWEIDPNCEPALRKTFPNAEIRIGDSYQLIKTCNSKADCVIADTWTFIFGDKHYESFELFPDLFDVLNESGIIILNVVIQAKRGAFKPEHELKRKSFYNAQDANNISLNQMVNAYSRLADQKGFEIKWWFSKSRRFLYPLRKLWINKNLYHLVFALERKSKD